MAGLLDTSNTVAGLLDSSNSVAALLDVSNSVSAVYASGVGEIGCVGARSEEECAFSLCPTLCEGADAFALLLKKGEEERVVAGEDNDFRCLRFSLLPLPVICSK